MLQMVSPLSASMIRIQNLCIAITMGLIDCISKKIYDVKSRNSSIAQSWDTNSSNAPLIDCSKLQNKEAISNFKTDPNEGESIKCADGDLNKMYLYENGKRRWFV